MDGLDQLRLTCNCWDCREEDSSHTVFHCGIQTSARDVDSGYGPLEISGANLFRDGKTWEL
jgi:hypothetical protein